MSTITNTFVLALLLACVAVTVPHANAALVISSQEACVAQPKLICVIRGTEGHNINGVVTFKPVWMKSGPKSMCQIRIRAQIDGLAPGQHGFHIHTYGDISAPDGASTGGHFANPWGGEVPHSLPRSAKRHWGDLGNISSNDAKMARYSRLNDIITMKGILGRGMTIHESADKGYGFQPSGDAGSRVANCVIGVQFTE